MPQAVWFPRTKLIRPQPPADLVVDEALVERVVDAARTVPLTLIRGAAGAGKTTLAMVAAAEIASTLGPAGDVGWIRLDDLDDDPGSLLDLLVAAFDGLVVDGCPGVRELLAAGLPASLDPRRAAGVLVNDLLSSGGPDPIVVVLDDRWHPPAPVGRGVRRRPPSPGRQPAGGAERRRRGCPAADRGGRQQPRGRARPRRGGRRPGGADRPEPSTGAVTRVGRRCPVATRPPGLGRLRRRCRRRRGD